MAIKLALKNLLISLLILASVFFFSQISKSYDDKTTHPGLTDEIVDFYNLSFPNEQLTSEEKEWIVQGSIDEDTPPRWINHFYDPTNGDGWKAENLGTVPPLALRLFSKIFLNANTEIVSSKNWAHNEILQSKYQDYGGNNTWENAIRQYINGDKNKAYYILGHILHLLEDATVPDHTRNDTHAHEGSSGTKDGGSPYEDYGKKYTRQTLTTAQDLKGKQPIALNSIDEYFDNLAGYSNKYFFSEHTINKKYEYPKILREDGNYGYGNDRDNNEFVLVNIKFIVKENFATEKIYTLKDNENNNLVLSSYFPRLSQAAVLNGAGVLQLFKQEVGKAEQQKNTISPEPTISWWQKMRSPLYGGIIPAFNFVSNFSDSLSSNIISAVNNNRQSLTTSSFLLLQNSLREQSSPTLALALQPTSTSPQDPAPTPTETPSVQPAPNQITPTPANELGNSVAKSPTPPAQNTQPAPNAVPWPGFVFAPASSPEIAEEQTPQEETNNQQQSDDNEPAPEQEPEPEPEPQDATPPAKPIITSHQNNQYLNESADEIPDEPPAPEEDEEDEEDEEENDPSQDEEENPDEVPQDEQENEYQEGVQITLKGTADHDSKVLISQTVPNSNLAPKEPSEIFVGAEGNFEYQITLEEGENILEIKARDQAGNESEAETLTLIFDLTPPETIDDLEANAGQNRGEIKITFTKPTDDFGIKEYEIRYSQKQIVETLTVPAEGEDANENEILFSDAEFSQTLNPSGQNQETQTISNLNPSQKYYFAAKSKDKASNDSEISNIAENYPSAKAEHLVISEFKIEGGNRNEADDEFIELYNPTDQEVSLDGWSIQYLGSNAKIENIKDNMQIFESENKIPAHSFFLIAKNKGYIASTPPDVSYKKIALSMYGGTFFLVNSTEPLQTPDDASIIDKVGYFRSYYKNIYPETNYLIIPSSRSSAAAFERKAFKNSTAESLRDQNQNAFSGNAYDTDDNAEDFVLQHPTNPQNSTALPEPKDENWNINLAASPWPTPFYDQKGSRRSPNAGPKQNPKIFWQTELDDKDIKTPAISQDNILYLLSQTSLFLLNLSDGRLLKQTKIINDDKTYGSKDYVSYYPVSGPVIDNFGTAYFSFKSSYNFPSGLGAATSEGKIRFLKENDGQYSASPPLIGQETIYQAPNSQQEVFRSFYPDGSKKWSFKANDAYAYNNSNPRMDENGNFYLRSYMWSWGGNSGKLNIVDKNGNLLAQSPMNGLVISINCTLLSDNYYFECGTYNNDYANLNIYGKNGKLLLSERSSADYTSAITQTQENEIIISRNYNGWSQPHRGRLYSYSILPNPEGVPKSVDQHGIASNEIKTQFNWYFELPENKAMTIPIVDGQGIIYFADSGGKVYAFDPSKGEIDSKTKKLSDGAILWTLDLGLPREGSQKDQIWYSNNLILDDKSVLYAVTEKGKVYAISEDLTVPPAPAEEQETNDSQPVIDDDEEEEEEE